MTTTTAEAKKPTTTLDALQPLNPAVITKPVRPDFGNGRYGPLANECFDELRRVFKCNDAQAEKGAKQIVSDFGAYMARANVGGLSAISFGKVSKDGKVTMKEAALKVKGATLTHGLQVLRAMVWVMGAFDAGFNYIKTDWCLNEGLAGDLNELVHIPEPVKPEEVKPEVKK